MVSPRLRLPLVLLLASYLLSTALGQNVHRNKNAYHRDRRQAASTLEDLTNVVETLSQKVETLQADMTGINNELQAKLTHESLRRHELEDKVDNFTKTHGGLSVGGVSFMAKYTPDLFNQQRLGAMKPLVLNTLVTNQGQGYNNATGVFSCTLPGTYVFFINAAAGVNATVMQLDMVVDHGEVLCGARTMMVRSNGAENLVPSSCQAVVSLQAGQTVWVRNLWDSAQYWGGLTHFGGLLVQRG